jgi:hypothetical protein
VWAPFGKRWRRLENRLDAIEHDREEMREFMREVYLRYERSFELLTTELQDMSEQVRENTSATWAMVDRLSGSG